MSDDNSTSNSSWSVRGLKRWLSTAPETRDELMRLVQGSHKFLQPDTVEMLEGVLDLPATQVSQIMTPRPNIVGINETDSLQDVINIFLETAHSRYPVFDSQDSDAIIGILLAKDLIPILVKIIRDNPNDHQIVLKDIVRQPVYINENARSDSLLRSIQKTQVHMAVVVDDFGNVAGVVTMEDLLEEIVGDIVDEHDDLEEDSDINNIIKAKDKANTWIVQASTSIEDCNEMINSHFDDGEVDTVGGLVMQALGNVGHLGGESVQLEDWQLTVVDVDGRFIKTIEVTRLD